MLHLMQLSHHFPSHNYETRDRDKHQAAPEPPQVGHLRAYDKWQQHDPLPPPPHETLSSIRPFLGQLSCLCTIDSRVTVGTANAFLSVD